MAKKEAESTFFDQLSQSLDDALAYTRGELELNTIVYPEPPPAMSAPEIQSLRERLDMSEQQFAATLNVSPRTVRAWESGERQPRQTSARLLQVLAIQPAIARQL